MTFAPYWSAYFGFWMFGGLIAPESAAVCPGLLGGYAAGLVADRAIGWMRFSNESDEMEG